MSSPETPGIIRRVVAHRDVVYAAFEDPTVGVWIFKRGKKVGELQDTGNRWSTWRDLLVFGEWVVGAFARGLAVWRRETGELYTEIEMADASGELTAVCHPSTYLNKLVVARRNGDLDIWNVKTGWEITMAFSCAVVANLVQQEYLYHFISPGRRINQVYFSSNRPVANAGNQCRCCRLLHWTDSPAQHPDGQATLFAECTNRCSSPAPEANH